uniref:Uncharacterized protein n=1 Tax=Arundo donax TaxID=35708 RepID=A0A0A9BRD7_ARUDO
MRREFYGKSSRWALLSASLLDNILCSINGTSFCVGPHKTRYSYILNL